PDAAGAKRSIRRGVFVVLVPIAAGIGAELLKLLSRRMRPETGDGFYRFKPIAGSVTSPEFWSTSGLGLASSHASVAVGAALAAGLVLPRWRWVLVAMAVLCCMSRLAVGAHYLSDVLAGAAIGVLCFRAIYAWDRRNNAGAPMPSGQRTLLSR
ncbi:MAG: phosphatase PAP2 family protein, partial [Phycisphaerales bacterium]|nr:phosphatase PAP2 family protein [Phycisphaerales bacterium]